MVVQLGAPQAGKISIEAIKDKQLSLFGWKGCCVTNLRPGLFKEFCHIENLFLVSIVGKSLTFISGGSFPNVSPRLPCPRVHHINSGVGWLRREAVWHFRMGHVHSLLKVPSLIFSDEHFHEIQISASFVIISKGILIMSSLQLLLPLIFHSCFSNLFILIER